VLHNQMGDWYRDGYSKAQWNELPRQMKAKFSYSRQFTKSQWEDFLSTVYNSKVDDRSVAIAQCRAEMHEDNLFDMGLYIGIAGTALMLAILILFPSAGISVSAAYASNIFGILCVAVVKIFHVRQTREALIIEAETAGGGADLDRTF